MSVRVQEALLRGELVRHMKATLSLEGVDFEIRFVDDIPLDKNGKLRIVVSKVNSSSAAVADAAEAVQVNL